MCSLPVVALGTVSRQHCSNHKHICTPHPARSPLSLSLLPQHLLSALSSLCTSRPTLSFPCRSQASLLCKATYEGKLDRLVLLLKAGCSPDAHDYGACERFVRCSKLFTTCLYDEWNCRLTQWTITCRNWPSRCGVPPPCSRLTSAATIAATAPAVMTMLCSWLADGQTALHVAAAEGSLAAVRGPTFASEADTVTVVLAMTLLSCQRTHAHMPTAPFVIHILPTPPLPLAHTPYPTPHTLPSLAQARVLIEAGATLTVKDRWGYTALDVAHKVGFWGSGLWSRV